MQQGCAATKHLGIESDRVPRWFTRRKTGVTRRAEQVDSVANAAEQIKQQSGSPLSRPVELGFDSICWLSCDPSIVGGIGWTTQPANGTHRLLISGVGGLLL